MKKCPLCGCDGDDLIFNFYCSNIDCENYKDNKENVNCNKNNDVFSFLGKKTLGEKLIDMYNVRIVHIDKAVNDMIGNCFFKHNKFYFKIYYV
jgi:hypothetical protein